MVRLDRPQLTDERVVVGVGDLRRVVGVVALVVVVDELAQLVGPLGLPAHRRRLAVAAIDPPRATSAPMMHMYRPGPTVTAPPSASFRSRTSPRSANPATIVATATTMPAMATPSTRRFASSTAPATTSSRPSVRNTGPSRTSSSLALVNPVIDWPSTLNHVTNEP